VLWIYPDLESLSHAAADLFIRQAKECVQARGRFSVALSGGRTPRRTYELLAQPPYRDRIDWPRMVVFWGDERCVPSNDPRSNARLAREALLDHVPIPAAQINPILCQASPEEGAKGYEALLRNFFQNGPPTLDLIFLGLGADGHTASLFPGSPALKEQTRWVAAVFREEETLGRVTLTPPFINQARAVAFLVAGADKAETLRHILQPPPDAFPLPARLINPASGQLHWLVDRAAAMRL